jgi:hypothetical protein
MLYLNSRDHVSPRECSRIIRAEMPMLDGLLLRELRQHAAISPGWDDNRTYFACYVAYWHLDVPPYWSCRDKKLSTYVIVKAATWWSTHDGLVGPFIAIVVTPGENLYSGIAWATVTFTRSIRGGGTYSISPPGGPVVTLVTDLSWNYRVFILKSAIIRFESSSYCSTLRWRGTEYRVRRIRGYRESWWFGQDARARFLKEWN